MISDSKLCLAALGPMSAALKAQHALLNAGVSAEVRALNPGESRNGCAYGVAFSCNDRERAKRALRAARINPMQYMTRDTT